MNKVPSIKSNKLHQFIEVARAVDYFFEDQDGFKLIMVDNCKNKHFADNSIEIDDPLIVMAVSNNGERKLDLFR